jgi:hypothetical protein
MKALFCAAAAIAPMLACVGTVEAKTVRVAHHRSALSPAAVHCPNLVEHDFISRWGQPVPFPNPVVYLDNGVPKCLSQDGYDMRSYPSGGGH